MIARQITTGGRAASNRSITMPGSSAGDAGDLAHGGAARDRGLEVERERAARSPSGPRRRRPRAAACRLSARAGAGPPARASRGAPPWPCGPPPPSTRARSSPPTSGVSGAAPAATTRVRMSRSVTMPSRSPSVDDRRTWRPPRPSAWPPPGRSSPARRRARAARISSRDRPPGKGRSRPRVSWSGEQADAPVHHLRDEARRTAGRSKYRPHDVRRDAVDRACPRRRARRNPAGPRTGAETKPNISPSSMRSSRRPSITSSTLPASDDIAEFRACLRQRRRSWRARGVELDLGAPRDLLERLLVDGVERRVGCGGTRLCRALTRWVATDISAPWPPLRPSRGCSSAASGRRRERRGRRGHQPGHGRVARAGGRRATARTRSARSPPPRRLPGVGRRAPRFERADAAPPRRRRAASAARDELARICTLDQGKPIAGVVRRGRRAGRDVARRRRGRHPHRGLDPAELRRGQARPADAPAEGAGRRRSRPGTGRTRCPPRSWRRRSPAATPSSGLRRRAPPSAPARWPSASPRPTCRPASSTSCPARARWWATRSCPTRARSRSASSAPPRPGRTIAERAAGKSLLLEMGGNGPLVVMDDADLARGRRGRGHRLLPVRRPELHGRASGCSCTRPCKDEFVELPGREVQRRGARSATRSTPHTVMGPLNNEPVAAKMDEHVEDARRARRRGRGGRQPRGRASPPTSTGRATVLDDVPADALAVTEETFGPIAPVVAIGSLDEAIELTNDSALRAAGRHLHRRPRRRPPLRRRGAQRAREHQRDDQLLGDPSPLRAGAPEPTAGSAAWAAAIPFEVLTELQTVVIGAR